MYMWAQRWVDIENLVQPNPDIPIIDVTAKIEGEATCDYNIKYIQSVTPHHTVQYLVHRHIILHPYDIVSESSNILYQVERHNACSVLSLIGSNSIKILL